MLPMNLRWHPGGFWELTNKPIHGRQTAGGERVTLRRLESDLSHLSRKILSTLLYKTRSNILPLN